jgi:hypothetical protein
MIDDLRGFPSNLPASRFEVFSFSGRKWGLPACSFSLGTWSIVSATFLISVDLAFLDPEVPTKTLL